jgi:hypothetical protein
MGTAELLDLSRLRFERCLASATALSLQRPSPFLSSREVVTFFDFPQNGLLIDVATALTTALALGTGPLLATTLSLFVIPSEAEGPAVRPSCAPLLPAHNLH